MLCWNVCIDSSNFFSLNSAFITRHEQHHRHPYLCSKRSRFLSTLYSICDYCSNEQTHTHTQHSQKCQFMPFFNRAQQKKTLMQKHVQEIFQLEKWQSNSSELYFLCVIYRTIIDSLYYNLWQGKYGSANNIANAIPIKMCRSSNYNYIFFFNSSNSFFCNDKLQCVYYVVWV